MMSTLKMASSGMHFYHATHIIGLYNASFAKVTIRLIKRNSTQKRGSARLFLNDGKVCVLTSNMTAVSRYIQLTCLTATLYKRNAIHSSR